MSVIDQFKLNDGHNFGLQLSIPIFNKLLVRNNIKRSNIQLESFQNQHEQIKLDLENTIYQAYNDTNCIKPQKKLFQLEKMLFKMPKKSLNLVLLILLIMHK